MLIWNSSVCGRSGGECGRSGGECGRRVGGGVVYIIQLINGMKRALKMQIGRCILYFLCMFIICIRVFTNLKKKKKSLFYFGCIIVT